MIKSELIAQLAEENPHLTQRDIERVVGVILERMIQAGAVPTTAEHFVYELQQDWGRQNTYQGVMDILKEHTAFGINVFFSKWALGEEIRQK